MSAVFPAAIYLLCALASVACAWLLMRGWRASGARLLLWAGLCFIGLAVNAALVVADLLVLPSVDLLIYRQLALLAAAAVLLFGCIWDVE